MMILLVWLPLGAFFASIFLAVMVFYILFAAMLFGFLPRTSRQKTLTRSGISTSEEIALWGTSALCFWMLFALTYAKKESDAFLALFPDLSWIELGLLGGWVPLGFIAQAVQRRRKKNREKLGHSPSD
jgi:hypothetical protein